MKKNSLVPNKGLSLSQAQSISNLCNQAALAIENTFKVVNNYKKTIFVSNSNKTLINDKPLPDNTVELLKRKSLLHACQAFLMENIKAKEEMFNEIRYLNADISSVEIPKTPNFVKISKDILEEVKEKWGWEQLSISETNEYLEVEAYAAHIGQFIHKYGVLDKLREELPNIPSIEWMEINKDQKTPVDIIIHHTSEELLKLHITLANEHRKYEQRVNYFKAKVKNLVTTENSRINRHNSDVQSNAEKINNDLRVEFDNASKKANAEINIIKNTFEQERLSKIAEIATLRINVDPRFQSIVDEFLIKE